MTEPALRSQWGERRKEVQREGGKGRWEEGERERPGSLCTPAEHEVSAGSSAAHPFTKAQVPCFQPGCGVSNNEPPVTITL